MEGQTEHIMLTVARRGSGKSDSTGAILQPFTNLEEEKREVLIPRRKKIRKERRTRKQPRKML